MSVAGEGDFAYGLSELGRNRMRREWVVSFGRKEIVRFWPKQR